MSCFWQELLRCVDTSCGNPTLILATPAKLQNAADLANWPLQVFNDVGDELFPTTASITHIAGYFTGSPDEFGCDYLAWYNDGDYSVDPPNTTGDAPFSNDVTGVAFDPTTDNVPIGAVPGITSDMSGVYLDGQNMFVAFLTIETDVGTCLFVCGADYCE